MKLAGLLEQIDKKWQKEFCRFIESGDASEGFLAYLDADENAQQAVEAAFNEQSQAFLEVARLVPDSGQSGQMPAAETAQMPDVSEELAKAMTLLVHLSAREQKKVLSKTRSKLTRLGAEGSAKVKQFAKSLSD